MDYLQQIVGFIVLLLAGALFSTNIRKIKLSFIVNAILIQFTLAFILIKLPIITQLFETISKVVITLKYATNQGTAFVFGYLADGAPNAPFAITEPTNTFIFAFGGLTLVIVISALSALLWHWRIIPPIVNALSVLFKRPLNVGGPLGLSATANIIFGQIETPLLVKPYLSSMSRRELLILMTVGMATISGSIMVVLTTFLNDLYGPALIGHFLIASIISVPAAIMYGNIMIPEDYKTEFPDSSTSNLYSNSMDAITTGTTNGLNIFMNIVETTKSRMLPVIGFLLDNERIVAFSRIDDAMTKLANRTAKDTVLDTIGSSAEGGKIFWDVGANFGGYSLYGFLRCITVLSFEPFTFQLLYTKYKF